MTPWVLTRCTWARSPTMSSAYDGLARLKHRDRQWSTCFRLCGSIDGNGAHFALIQRPSYPRRHAKAGRPPFWRTSIPGWRRQTARPFGDKRHSSRNIQLGTLESAYQTTVTALVNTLEEKDHYTADHSESRLLSSSNRGGDETQPGRGRARLPRGPLHDIGKLAVRSEELNKAWPAH